MNRWGSDFTPKIAGSAICPGSPVKSHLSVSHVCDVATFAQELHHFLARPYHLCPSGFRVWILLKPTNIVAIKHEVDLSQAALGSAPNGVSLCLQLDRVVVFHEGLSPNLDQCLFERRCHRDAQCFD